MLTLFSADFALEQTRPMPPKVALAVSAHTVFALPAPCTPTPTTCSDPSQRIFGLDTVMTVCMCANPMDRDH